jgi:hypothetical protein
LRSIHWSKIAWRRSRSRLRSNCWRIGRHRHKDFPIGVISTGKSRGADAEQANGSLVMGIDPERRSDFQRGLSLRKTEEIGVQRREVAASRINGRPKLHYSQSR